jgi:hypothetical protein
MATLSQPCQHCGESINPLRTELGYKYCLDCGETRAKQVKHCIVPMPKSNYIVVTDMALLIGLNTSHKGGVR